MFVSTTTLQKGSRTYRYTRVQEAYRDGSGKPRNRVLASFRDLPEVAERNLKAAVAAARQGKAVVVADEVSSKFATVAMSLRYLDVSVALKMWERWELSRLLEEQLRRRDVQMSISDVIAALTVHRCVAPGSKLSAERWYPRTALAELQGIEPGRFNNTRVHRALKALHEIEEPLQRELASRIHHRRSGFAALFLDMTDTWFEGQGPELAAKGRVKDGSYKRRIGIVLLCDDRGLPLRWKTLSGRYRESDTMRAVVEQIADLDWAAEVPLVMDRAMGRDQTVEFLANSGTHFITAVPVDEFASHTDRIPHETTAQVDVAGTPGGLDDDLHRVRKAAVRAGYTKVSDARYVLDLRTMKKSGGTDRRVVRRRRSNAPSRTVGALRLAQALQQGRREGRTISELAQEHGCGSTTVKRHLQLLRLGEPIHRRVMAGEADALGVEQLREIATLRVADQEQAFDEACEPSTPTPLQRHAKWTEPEPPIELRYIVHFNPERFVEQRRVAMEQERELEVFVNDLNRRLQSPNSRRTQASVRAEVDRQLRKKKLLSVFRVGVEQAPEDDTCLQVALIRDEEAWRLRRRYDGINLFVAHLSLQLSAAEVVELYFAKDQVEKDFGTIKGVVELRPIRHRTDPKVCAHVTLCMLALLLERTLEQELVQVGMRRSAPDVLEALADCRLNRMESGAVALYSTTRLTDEQRQLLRALQLEDLADDNIVREHIRPRQ